MPSLNPSCINTDGFTKCKKCGKKLRIGEAVSCRYCDYFFCRTCTTKIEGYEVCSSCAQFLSKLDTKGNAKIFLNVVGIFIKLAKLIANNRKKK